MIFCSGGDLIRPIDLLQQHDPGQMVGEGHGGHGQPPVRLPLQALVQPHAAADEKGQLLSLIHISG